MFAELHTLRNFLSYNHHFLIPKKFIPFTHFSLINHPKIPIFFYIPKKLCPIEGFYGNSLLMDILFVTYIQNGVRTSGFLTNFG